MIYSDEKGIKSKSGLKAMGTNMQEVNAVACFIAKGVGNRIVLKAVTVVY